MDKLIRDRDGTVYTIEQIAKKFANRIHEAFEKDLAEGRFPPGTTIQDALEAMLNEKDDAVERN